MKKNCLAKYASIADALKKDILSGKYDNHERFPSEEALVRRFGASRPTIERALRVLKQEGLLESRAGSGSYLTFAAKNATGAIGIIAPDYRAIEFFTKLCDAIASEA
ncbi:MAG: winged helix-turn-helix transcriptional regulator, partial [Kiritimatiellae bacterium]|nr:winged helix-turn-helix transcriptional regulator [Kiritimatiellia bacterium]